jgi:hypothetical protein
LQATGKQISESIWQRNYYEHVIRNEKEFDLVREYILFNPIMWPFDTDNPDRVHDLDYSNRWKWLED